MVAAKKKEEINAFLCQLTVSLTAISHDGFNGFLVWTKHGSSEGEQQLDIVNVFLGLKGKLQIKKQKVQFSHLGSGPPL